MERVSLEMKAIQNALYCVGKPATHRADRPDPSRRNVGLLGMTIRLAPARYSRRNIHESRQPHLSSKSGDEWELACLRL